ncbi:MAG: carbamoyltransferase C-terminal domain-containing protein [Deltaproteobacteria bacterium]|nr:carbamoyltransferase C-terminal domain-containing protein [Deltaproteobacteria bacterium]
MREAAWILGLSCSHNGAACLLHGEELVVAIQEERLTREKRAVLPASTPSRAIAYCFDAAGIGPGDLDLVVSSSIKAGGDVASNPQLEVKTHGTPTLSIGHHLAHAWAAFATSGFSEAAVLVIDGAGSPLSDLDDVERALVVPRGLTQGRESISIYGASLDGLRPLVKHAFPGEAWLSDVDDDGAGMRAFHSLGAMFSAVAEQVFGSKWEAGKVMGLAPYGRPTIPPEDFFVVDDDGAFCFRDVVSRRFTGAARWPARSGAYEDLAASVQQALEHALALLVTRASTSSGSRHLCCAGGVALNGIANEKILFAPGSPFDDVYVMPAAEDSGPALGAAWFGRHQLAGPWSPRRLTRDALGRSYAVADVLAAVAAARLAGPGLDVVDAADPIAATVELLCAGQVVGWFQGGAELGPRALGQRSILLDPRLVDGKDLLNARVKHREPFRPFAPAVLLEEVQRWFTTTTTPASPFMLRVRPFLEEVRALVPAVVHVDGTGRLQTLTREDNGALYELVRAFFARTGVPMLLNTSFNIAGMPIVETPADALSCMLATGIDCCVLEGALVMKRGR